MFSVLVQSMRRRSVPPFNGFMPQSKVFELKRALIDLMADLRRLKVAASKMHSEPARRVAILQFWISGIVWVSNKNLAFSTATAHRQAQANIDG